VSWTGIQANLYWILFSAGLVAVALWEVWRPWRTISEQLARRWRNHALLVGIAAGVSVLVFRASGVAVAVAVANSKFGLLNKPWLPLAMRWILGFVLLDLLRYGLHRAFHSVPLLWRVHQVHHSDPDVDLSTGLRNHPLEAIAAQGAFCLAIAVLAPPPSAVVAMELVAILQAFFSHANANLPVCMERLVRTIVVTPRMHRVHHSEEMREQNANLGEVFPWWDRIFGTYLERPAAGFDDMRFGLEGSQNSASAGLLFMLTQPFRPSRQSSNELEHRESAVLTQAVSGD
jgi:sterol desaturase/sphingolipid hydroxylase (fatty acid hydroxylase superfamily)